ncbi:hypothetical protein J6590_051209 [Homalodisca vitripennis]|nr:hypothetical protein J6590_051209 [Homalodisca vitripennis]
MLDSGNVLCLVSVCWQFAGLEPWSILANETGLFLWFKLSGDRRRSARVPEWPHTCATFCALVVDSDFTGILFILVSDDLLFLARYLFGGSSSALTTCSYGTSAYRSESESAPRNLTLSTCFYQRASGHILANETGLFLWFKFCSSMGSYHLTYPSLPPPPQAPGSS